MKYVWIYENRHRYNVAALCRCLNVVRSGYYAWVHDSNGIEDESDIVLLAEIRDVMAMSRQSYGIKRVTRELKDRGFDVNHKRVERLMRENNIRPKRAKKFKKTTDSNHQLGASEDRLQRRFNDVSQPDRVWTSDITYVKTREGWLYLCVWIDLFSRKIVGWSTSSSLASSFVCKALISALNRRPGARPLIHSDRGVQYASKEFRQLLWKNKLRQSMSRKGNCWDNAVSESFFSTLKFEADLKPSMSVTDIRQEIFEYIETFYNRRRLHSTMGYKSPQQVENMYWSRKAAS